MWSQIYQSRKEGELRLLIHNLQAPPPRRPALHTATFAHGEPPTPFLLHTTTTTTIINCFWIQLLFPYPSELKQPLLETGCQFCECSLLN